MIYFWHKIESKSKKFIFLVRFNRKSINNIEEKNIGIPIHSQGVYSLKVPTFFSRGSLTLFHKLYSLLFVEVINESI